MSLSRNAWHAGSQEERKCKLMCHMPRSKALPTCMPVSLPTGTLTHLLLHRLSDCTEMCCLHASMLETPM